MNTAWWHRFSAPTGGFEPVRDFDASKAGGRFVQSKDKATGLPLWQVDVIDGDPAARDKSVRVKVTAPEQPVLPPAASGLPFVPVEFAGLTITPYVNQGGRLAGDCPDTRRTATRSVHLVTVTLPSTGTTTRPR
jgi:hypothetical protein